MSPRIAALLGYDPDRVAELVPGQQRALALAVLAAVPGVLLLGAAAAYGTFLASDAVALGAAVGLGAGLYLLNLLRVAVAGGGVGPQQPIAVVTTWMPRAVPLVMLGLLGVFFAQPLILALLAAEQDAPVEELRRALGASHREAVLEPAAEERRGAEAALEGARARHEARRQTLAARLLELESLGAGQDGRQTLERAVAEDRGAVEALGAQAARAAARLEQARLREAQADSREVQPYLRHLATSHFLLRRVQLTWARPVRPVLLSAVMVLLMVLPWFASATFARGAARAYEARRWNANRKLIDAAYSQTRRLEAEALSRWPTFQKPRLELHEDAPYNTRPRAGAGAFEARHG